MRDRSIIGQRLHQHDGDAASDGRARERQRHAGKDPPGAKTQRPRHVQRRSGLLEEGRTREEIDIGIERRDEDQRCAFDRTDIGKPVIADAPAGEIAQPGLRRPRRLKEVRQGVGDDIGRRGQRQNQRPGEPAPAGKLEHGRRPGRSHADHQRARRRQARQNQRVRDITWEDRAPQMRPDLARRRRKLGQDCDGRQSKDGGDEPGGQRPAPPVPPRPPGPGFLDHHAHWPRLYDNRSQNDRLGATKTCDFQCFVRARNCLKQDAMQRFAPTTRQ